ncbi:peptide-methionine (S)-S-oxide reductase MsrA [Phenylobacterium sp. J426]|uniref:peptide-methionine (S)-S-oxide reductase MsrA n=1 Tax=Phenylobacterium sp. J426 TaxID=2898439 RepID=UPI002150E7DE|nr:peptide-methionine (S)-S-oxide reductase MsrA [Phenylobacterium sp. J426]MCR5873520.1 peptide-methionine (S)-S-oxide reductase MsrA [Phenylobacterium sp. J426]
MRHRTLLAAAAAALLIAPAAAGAAGAKTAVFAGGCFWSVEKFFEARAGVVSAVSGYAGGTSRNPTYENHEGHMEVVRVTYDPAKVSYAELVDHFFRNIDPTDPNGQICDKGPAYRTAVFVSTPEERRIAEQAKSRVAGELKAKVATQVRNAAPFWMAEGYHQDFAKKNPAQYERYRIGCGRDPWLRKIWGAR